MPPDPPMWPMTAFYARAFEFVSVLHSRSTFVEVVCTKLWGATKLADRANYEL